MKIKGLGPATIDKLEIVGINEIYEMPLDYLVEVLGEKLGSKLYEEIQKSRTCDFAVFLSALSIPLIGTVAAQKIARECNSIEEINETVLEIAGIGEKASANILDWLFDYGHELPKLSFRQQRSSNVSANLGKVCITGKLNSFSNRNEASEYLSKLGYTVITTVSKQTNYLVDEEGRSSSKRTKAEQLGIPIVTIKTLEENINE
jgi:NAD-dependent DNA ligase